MMVFMDARDDFFEEDEPLDAVIAAYEHGVKGFTRPSATWLSRTRLHNGVTQTLVVGERLGSRSFDLIRSSNVTIDSFAAH